MDKHNTFIFIFICVKNGKKTRKKMKEANLAQVPQPVSNGQVCDSHMDLLRDLRVVGKIRQHHGMQHIVEYLQHIFIETKSKMIKIN